MVACLPFLQPSPIPGSPEVDPEIHTYKIKTLSSPFTEHFWDSLSRTRFSLSIFLKSHSTDLLRKMATKPWIHTIHMYVLLWNVLLTRLIQKRHGRAEVSCLCCGWPARCRSCLKFTFVFIFATCPDPELALDPPSDAFTAVPANPRRLGPTLQKIVVDFAATLWLLRGPTRHPTLVRCHGSTGQHGKDFPGSNSKVTTEKA